MFAKRYEDPPDVWGVGRVVVGGEVTPWPVAQADIDDEAESLAPRLAALGLEPGGLVLVVAMLSQRHARGPVRAGSRQARRVVLVRGRHAVRRVPGRVRSSASSSPRSSWGSPAACSTD